MSSGGRNRTGRGTAQNIDLEAVLSFMHMLLCMAAGIGMLALLGMVLTALAGGDLIIYQMTLAVDAVMLIGGGISIRKLRIKASAMK